MNRIAMAGPAAAIAIAAVVGFPGTAMPHAGSHAGDLPPLRPGRGTCHFIHNRTGEVAHLPCELRVF